MNRKPTDLLGRMCERRRKCLPNGVLLLVGNCLAEQKRDSCGTSAVGVHAVALHAFDFVPDVRCFHDFCAYGCNAPVSLLERDLVPVIAYANGSPLALEETADLVEHARAMSLAVIAGLHAFSADEATASEEREAVRAMLPDLDFLVMNEDEARQFTKKQGALNGAVKAIRELLTTPTCVFVTRGGAGALRITRDESIFYAAPRVPSQRTLAAGDAFLAGLAFGFASSSAMPARRAAALENARIAALTTAGNWVSGVENLRSPFRLDEGAPLTM